MQLRVQISFWGFEAGEQKVTIRKFSDVTRIGAIVARSVREWIREVPMTPHGSRCSVHVTAEWLEGQAGKEQD